jgi:prolyl 4-hydroxylase
MSLPSHALNPHLIRQVDGQRFLRVESDRLELYLILDFLSPAECELLIRTGGHKLRRSTVTVPIDDPDYRTSQTCDIGFIDEPMVPQLQQRIAQTLGAEITHAEVMQLQRYAPGEQFKGHTDYFEPGSQEYAENAKVGGNRTWTCMIYLNEVPAGGETRFDALGLAFKSRPGMAVVWNNHWAGEVNPHSVHAGLPVQEGLKYVVTQWFREQPLVALNPSSA